MRNNEIVTIERRGDTMLARCRGELDLATHDELRRAISRVPEPATDVVILDLAPVEFMDCSGLGVVVELARRCAQAEAGFVLSGAVPVVRRLLTALNLDQVLDSAPTVSEALALTRRWVADGSDSTSRVRTALLPPPRLPPPLAAG
jgi:anti-sigma B factor antagonist